MDSEQRGVEGASRPDANNGPSGSNVSGGVWNNAVFGTKIIEKTVIHNHTQESSVSSDTKSFKLEPGIIVYENNPICPQSRIYRAKLLSRVTGDLDIAVKLLPFGGREEMEARIHFLVPHHENIVERIFTDTFSYRGQQTIYIAMECCDEQNMYDYVKSQATKGVPFDSKLYLDYARQVANGVEFLHRHNVINRDLKPPNLLLAKNKTIVKIADFGLSKQISPGRDDATLSKMYPGTIGWNAPEVLLCIDKITTLSDIFPLGLVFHFLWSYGKHPYGDDPDSWNHYIKRGENCKIDLMLMPENMATVLLESMLNIDPVKRPTAKAVLKHAIFQPLDEVTELRAPEEETSGSSSDPSNYDKPSLILSRDQIDLRTCISRGRFNEVWKGRVGKREAAIKKRVPGIMSVERFHVMANVMMILHHQNIVECLGVEFKECLVAMEFMDRGCLLNFFKSVDGRSTTFKDHINMAVEIASGMEHVEKQRYIHRNLRAANIMIGANLVCKVADFDSSRYVGDGGAYKAAPGGKYPIKWMAPEIFSDRPFTIKSDVWSFGILLTEVITKGGVPYPGISKLDTRRKVSNGHKMLKPLDCSDRLYNVMLQCWRDCPQDRPSFRKLTTILKGFLSTEEES